MNPLPSSVPDEAMLIKDLLLPLPAQLTLLSDYTSQTGNSSPHQRFLRRLLNTTAKGKKKKKSRRSHTLLRHIFILPSPGKHQGVTEEEPIIADHYPGLPDIQRVMQIWCLHTKNKSQQGLQPKSSPTLLHTETSWVL